MLRKSIVPVSGSYSVILACTLLLTGTTLPQSSEDGSDKRLIERAQRMLVSTLDGSLPKVTLDYFVRYEAAGSEVRWEVNDCGEQTGDAETDRDRDIPTCVEADFLVDQRAVTLMIAVGSVKQGLSKAPSMFSAAVTDSNGQVHSLRTLSELPKELHRPLPKAPRGRPSPAPALQARALDRHGFPLDVHDEDSADAGEGGRATKNFPAGTRHIEQNSGVIA